MVLSIEELRNLLKRYEGRERGIVLPIEEMEGVFLLWQPARYGMPEHLKVIINPIAVEDPDQLWNIDRGPESVLEPEIHIYGKIGVMAASHQQRGKGKEFAHLNIERLDELEEELARQKEWHEKWAWALGEILRILKDRRLLALCNNLEEANPREVTEE